MNKFVYGIAALLSASLMVSCSKDSDEVLEQDENVFTLSQFKAGFDEDNQNELRTSQKWNGALIQSYWNDEDVVYAYSASATYNPNNGKVQSLAKNSGSFDYNSGSFGGNQFSGYQGMLLFYPQATKSTFTPSGNKGQGFTYSMALEYDFPASQTYNDSLNCKLPMYGVFTKDQANNTVIPTISFTTLVSYIKFVFDEEPGKNVDNIKVTSNSTAQTATLTYNTSANPPVTNVFNSGSNFQTTLTCKEMHKEGNGKVSCIMVLPYKQYNDLEIVINYGGESKTIKPSPAQANFSQSKYKTYNVTLP